MNQHTNIHCSFFQYLEKFALIVDFLLLPVMLLTFDTADYASEEDKLEEGLITYQTTQL